MSERSELFTNLSEIDSRPAFSLSHEIRPDNFRNLVGEYHLDTEAFCQVKSDRGLCHHKHKHGWLGVTQDGHEVLIGCDCAHKYFRAHKTFGIEKKRVSKEIERFKALSKLSEYQSNPALLTSELAALRQTLIDTRRDFDQVFKLFPGSVMRFIVTAQRTLNWEIKVDIEQPRLKQNDHTDGNKGEQNVQTTRWVRASLGRLKPAPFMSELTGLMVRIKELQSAATDVIGFIPDQVSTPRLKKKLNILSEKGEIANAVATLEKQVHEFIQSRNLEMLIYVADDYGEERLAVKAIMAIGGAKVSSEGHVSLRLRRIKERACAQLGVSNVRKNQLVDHVQRSSIFGS